MIYEIEKVDSRVKAPMLPVNILPSADEFIRIWVPMVIESEEEQENGEEVTEENPDNDDFADNEDLEDNDEDENEGEEL